MVAASVRRTFPAIFALACAGSGSNAPDLAVGALEDAAVATDLAVGALADVAVATDLQAPPCRRCSMAKVGSPSWQPVDPVIFRAPVGDPGDGFAPARASLTRLMGDRLHTMDTYPHESGVPRW